MLLLTCAVVLLAAVLVSALAWRTVLSTAVLFPAAGFALGAGSPPRSTRRGRRRGALCP